MEILLLDTLMPQSVIKDFIRGQRRYFPIKSKIKKGTKYLEEVFVIIYGREPKDKEEVIRADFYYGFDKYIERFDNKLWIRTTYKVK